MSDKSRQRAREAARNGADYQPSLPRSRRGSRRLGELELRCDYCKRSVMTNPGMSMVFVVTTPGVEDLDRRRRTARRFYVCHKLECDVRLRQLPMNAGHEDVWSELRHCLGPEWTKERDYMLSHFDWHPEARARRDRFFKDVEHARASGFELPASARHAGASKVEKRRSPLEPNARFEEVVLQLVHLLRLRDNPKRQSDRAGFEGLDDFLDRAAPVAKALEEAIADLSTSVLRKLLVLAEAGRGGRSVFDVELHLRRSNDEDMKEALLVPNRVSGLEPGLARARDEAIDLEAERWSRGGGREFEVQCDYATSERAGAGGMFQVTSLMEGDDDVTNLVDQDRHFSDLEELRVHLVGVTGTEVELVEE